ncbi:spore germination protein [Paenibacillus sp. LHD-117]|uniref:spore germination protein n=1 Tax=Paenibacillus sp. LHD-117 TaxID=3071412 RepID=UPI0027DF567C|nr:spore germination protein [Paenibacillus sp. LHD-117]MDQ6418139.1 spore germination protein [Paenibacillus sp. LHD-117]
MKNSSYRLRNQAVRSGSHSAEKDDMPLSADLQSNVDYIHFRLHTPGDLITKEIELGRTGFRCILMNLDGMIDKNLVHDHLMKPIIAFGKSEEAKGIQDAKTFIETLKDEVLPLEGVQSVFMRKDAIHSILSGNTCLLLDGTEHVLVIGSCGWMRRQIEEPQTESLIRGPKDGFTEDIRTNSSLIRRRIKDPSLRLDSYMIGERSKQEVMVAYVDGIVNPKLVAEVKRRLLTIDVDDVEGSGFIEQWIADSFLSPFPQIMDTERPDKFAASLMQGKVGLIVDGTPFQLVMPITISSAFNSPEDYYQHWLISSLIRTLRFISAFVATFLPGFYIALAEYHHGMIPSNIAFSIASAREGVPFPVFIEALLMEGTLEILREAGVRLPKPIGQTIGIVGGLVIGEAAVAAGIVSPVMVIVVAVTAIASFTLPSYSFGIVTRILRFIIMLAASVLGLFGVILAFLVICIHLVNLKSFGVPYLTPISPMFPSDWKDLILRAPVTFLRKRPQMMQTEDKNKMSERRRR